MNEKFRRKKWEELRELENGTAILKTASHDLDTKDVAFTMTILQPGQSVRHHHHGVGTAEEGAEEIYFLMDGKSQVKVDDEVYEAEAIEIFYFAPGTLRSVYNHSDKPATWIFLAPMRPGFKDAYSRAD